MKKITVSILTTLLMLSMVFSSSVFAANEKVSAWDSFLGLFGVKATETSDVGVEYRGHVENKGDFPVDGTWIQGPDRLGTVGEGLRLEAFWIKLAEDAPEGLHIKYQVHVQNKGWMGFVNDGAMAGTEGEGLRIEAIEIALVDDEGDIADGYSVEYRGHVQNIGDTEWYVDGDQLGTTGSGLRLEALEIKIVQTKADMTAYEAALAAVEEADYTKASWAAYQAVVDANVVTEDNSQAEVDAATAIILDAQEDLVTVPVIAGMTATGQKAITVTGIQLADLKASMLTVAGNTVTSVVANADGTSAVVTLGTNLAPETNVKVTATVDGTAKEYTVKYSIVATTVVIEDQTFDYIQDGQKVSLLVNGVATTVDYLKEQGYTVTFAAWDSNGTSATTTLFKNATDGVINTPFSADKDYTAQVTIVKEGIVATSAKANIKIRNLNNNISDITAVTLKNYASGAPTFTNASKTLVVGESAQVTKVVVGYGDAAAELSGQVGYTVESDNSAVVSVNSSGVITANGLGTVNLTITAGKATYNLPLTIVGTARKATTVGLKDGASSFTYVVLTGTDSRTVTIAVKDQYGDPFYKTSTTGVNFAIPTGITGLALDASTPSPIGSTDVKGEANIILKNATKTGQSGNIVFRNNDDAVIGTAAIVTSGDNVAVSKKLVVTNGPTDFVIDTELASKATITVEVHNFNASGVDLGKVSDLTNYVVTCDPKVISVAAATANGTTGYKITSGSSFNITGLKAGSTTMLVSTPAPDNQSVETKTVVVTKGTVKLSGANFLSPATVTSVKTINYQDVLGVTEATGKDPILTGVTTTPSTVYNLRICTTAIPSVITVGEIYLDKNADGLFTNTGSNPDSILGKLAMIVTPSSGSTGWNTYTDSVAGIATVLGNKGNVTFNLLDTVTSSTSPVTIASKSVAVNVPTTVGAGPALTADTSSNDVDTSMDITYTDDATWRAAVNSVTVNGTALTVTTDYTLASGKLTLIPSGGNAALQTAGSKTVVVNAPGYTASTVTQVIDAGAVASMTVTQLPVLGTRSGTSAVAMATQPIVTLKDQYDNVCSTGTSKTANVVASVNGATIPVGATIGGTTTKAAVAGVAIFTDLTVTPGTDARITDLNLRFTSGGITVDVDDLTSPVE